MVAAYTQSGIIGLHDVFFIIEYVTSNPRRNSGPKARESVRNGVVDSVIKVREKHLGRGRKSICVMKWRKRTIL